MIRPMDIGEPLNLPAQDIATDLKRPEAPAWMNPKVQPAIKVIEGQDRLGFGAISQTFKAELTIPDHSPYLVAVKIPSQESMAKYYEPKERTEAQYRQMEVDENILLRQFRNRHHELFPNSPSPFPFSRLAYLQESPVKQPFPAQFQGQPALILELMPHENDFITLNWDSRLSNYLKEHPEAMRSALVHYLEAMVTVNSLGLGAPDRKYGDFFYFPEEDRLVVLDWNVVKPLNREMEQKFRDLESVKDATQSQYGTFVKTGILAGLKVFADSTSSKFWSEENIDKLNALIEQLRNNSDYNPSAIDVLEMVKGLRVGE